MPKYNIIELKKKEAHYRSMVSPEVKDALKERILEVIVMQKKYKDPTYSAKKLAQELDTNTRYISAVVNTRFHCNYSTFINKYRIDDAMSLLTDKRYQRVRVEDIGTMVGFANRQTFYGSFYRFLKMTPKEYRLANSKK